MHCNNDHYRGCSTIHISKPKPKYDNPTDIYYHTRQCRHERLSKCKCMSATISSVGENMPLHAALYNGYRNINKLKSLITANSINQCTKFGYTPLMFVACNKHGINNYNLEFITSLVTNDNINLRNHLGQTALMCLFINKYNLTEIDFTYIKFLISKSDINIVTNSNQNALMLGLINKLPNEIIKLLINDVTVNNVDEFGCNALNYAVRNKVDIEILKLLANPTTINNVDEAKYTALMYAVTTKYDNDVLKLLISDQNINQQNKAGDNALTLSINTRFHRYRNDTMICEILEILATPQNLKPSILKNLIERVYNGNNLYEDGYKVWVPNYTLNAKILKFFITPETLAYPLEKPYLNMYEFAKAHDIKRREMLDLLKLPNTYYVVAVKDMYGDVISEMEVVV